MPRLMRFSIVVLAILTAAPAFAQNLGDLSERIQFHGFGTWAYGQTDGNDYLYGSEEGDYSHALFHLNLSARVTERLNISAQVGWVQDNEGSTVDFDYAFAEWKFSDLARLRLGKVKHPLGLFGEILNVGTLRPFVNLPQSVYGPESFTGTGYNGLGLTGEYHTDKDWGVLYDVYAGQLQVEDVYPYVLLFGVFQDPQFLREGSLAVHPTIEDVLGTRLTIATPGGLRFGLSAFTGWRTPIPEIPNSEGQIDFLGVHLQYLSNRLWIRSEIIHVSKEREGPRNAYMDGGYGEIAYKLTERWQIAARYDIYEITSSSDLSAAPSFVKEYLHHSDTALGVNFWLHQKLVLKLSYHMVDGIRFASAAFDDPLRVLMHDEFEAETNLIQFGAQFSF